MNRREFLAAVIGVAVAPTAVVSPVVAVAPVAEFAVNVSDQIVWSSTMSGPSFALAS